MLSSDGSTTCDVQGNLPADGRADSVAKLGGVPGDNVNGFAAETVTMAASAFTLMPAGYTFEQAATLPCAAATAWRALMVEAKPAVLPACPAIRCASAGLWKKPGPLF